MELSHLIQAVVRRWWLFAVLGAAGLAVAYFASVAAPKKYESAVTLQLNPAARGALLAYGSDGNASGSLAMLAASYGEVLRSRAFGELVVQQLNLSVPPQSVASAITARLVLNTNILRLSVTWSDPQDAQQLAQAIAEIFVAENARRQGGGPGSPSSLATMEETARSYPSRVEALRQQRDRLDQAVNRGDLSRLQELNNIESRLAALESSYANLLVEINRARSGIDTATILDSAAPAVTSGALPVSRALPFGLASGLGLALALAFLLDRLDDRIRGPEDVVNIVGAGPLVAVGRIRAHSRQSAGLSEELVMVHAPRTPLAETFRTLRANIRFATADSPCKLLVVTSASAGEGKSLIAANLAIAFAQAGERVLLVDADLRRPNVHKIFGVSNRHGYLEAVMALATPDNRGHNPAAVNPEVERHQSASTTIQAAPAVIPSGVENLSLLPAGSMHADPTSILGSPVNAQFLERLTELWDMVIFDTAPVGPVTDTRLLAAHTDAIVLVARDGATSRSSLVSCLQGLSMTGRPILGVVLNCFDPGLLTRYSAYSSYYYYGRSSYYNGTPDSEEPARNGNGHVGR